MKRKLNKTVLLPERNRHTPRGLLHPVLAGRYLILSWPGSTPFCPAPEVPHPGLVGWGGVSQGTCPGHAGASPARSGWGTPLGLGYLGPVTGVPWKEHGTCGSIMGWRWGTRCPPGANPLSVTVVPGTSHWGTSGKDMGPVEVLWDG